MLKLLILLLAQNTTAYIGYKIGAWQKLLENPDSTLGSRYYTAAMSESFLFIEMFQTNIQIRRMLLSTTNDLLAGLLLWVFRSSSELFLLGFMFACLCISRKINNSKLMYVFIFRNNSRMSIQMRSVWAQVWRWWW